MNKEWAREMTGLKDALLVKAVYLVEQSIFKAKILEGRGRGRREMEGYKIFWG